MQGLGILPLFLLLPAGIVGDFPDFDDEDDGDDGYYDCEGDACVYRDLFLYFPQNIQVPNKSVTYEEYAYFDVNKVSLLADCAPSLSVGDITTTIKTCQEVDWKYQDACKYRKKGWLGQDGKTVNDSLATAFDEIEGVSENIAKCLEWDGIDDYDYDYYDHGYYGDYLEEFDNTQVRTKRDLKMNVPEFMKQKIRNRRGAKEKKNDGENQSGTRSRNVKKKKPRKGKNRSRNRNKGKNKRNNKKGSNGKGGNNGNKKPKIKRNKNRKGNKSGKKGKKGKNRNNNKKKGGRKNTKEEKKKEEKKKKKEEKRERKMLKQIDLDSKPSDKILNKLECVERAIEYGLEKCGEKIFTNLDLL